jgi:hypothetical protein
MKIRFCFTLALLMVATTVIGHGQTHVKDNGFWWADSSTAVKLAFVRGYATAMTHVVDIEGFRCLAERNGGTIPEKFPGDEALNACTSQNPRVAPYEFEDIPFGQLSEGLDAFYKDFRNKTIEINLAMAYVRDELKGKPTNELDEELTRYRSTSH